MTNLLDDIQELKKLLQERHKGGAGSGNFGHGGRPGKRGGSTSTGGGSTSSGGSSSGAVSFKNNPEAFRKEIQKRVGEKALGWKGTGGEITGVDLEKNRVSFYSPSEKGAGGETGAGAGSTWHKMDNLAIVDGKVAFKPDSVDIKEIRETARGSSKEFWEKVYNS